MSKLTFVRLSSLIPDMNNCGVEKEHFAFNYAKQRLDCIFSVCSDHYELLVGVLVLNFGFVVKVTQNNRGNYIAEITEDDYHNFCRALNLTYKDDGFTSNTLLNLLSNHIPLVSNREIIPYETLRRYTSFRYVDEAEKIYFKGWNDHIRDGRTAHNFDKTEFYFGVTVANYCRHNNISSIWTDIPYEQERYRQPWQ